MEGRLRAAPPAIGASAIKLTISHTVLPGGCERIPVCVIDEYNRGLGNRARGNPDGLLCLLTDENEGSLEDLAGAVAEPRP